MDMNTLTCKRKCCLNWLSTRIAHLSVNSVSDFTSGIYGKTNAGLHAEIRAALDNGIQVCTTERFVLIWQSQR